MSKIFSSLASTPHSDVLFKPSCPKETNTAYQKLHFFAPSLTRKHSRHLCLEGLIDSCKKKKQFPVTCWEDGTLRQMISEAVWPSMTVFVSISKLAFIQLDVSSDPTFQQGTLLTRSGILSSHREKLKYQKTGTSEVKLWLRMEENKQPF